jgi:hypothetical protein
MNISRLNIMLIIHGNDKFSISYKHFVYVSNQLLQLKLVDYQPNKKVYNLLFYIYSNLQVHPLIFLYWFQSVDFFFN